MQHFDVNLIARHLCPSAFSPYDKWSSRIADKRQKARLAAQRLIRSAPDKARQIMAENRARKLEAKAASLRHPSQS